MALSEILQISQMSGDRSTQILKNGTHLRHTWVTPAAEVAPQTNCTRVPGRGAGLGGAPAWVFRQPSGDSDVPQGVASRLCVLLWPSQQQPEDLCSREPRSSTSPQPPASGPLIPRCRHHSVISERLQNPEGHPRLLPLLLVNFTSSLPGKTADALLFWRCGVDCPQCQGRW